MSDNRHLSAVILGAGNVATHIATRISGKIDVVQIFSRDKKNAEILSDKIGGSAVPTDDPAEITTDADIYIFSVKDDVIGQLASSMPKGIKGVAVHTSGSAPDNILREVSERYGVLYPLQTFSKHVPVEWDDITVFTYGESSATLSTIDEVAATLSPITRHATEAERGRLHIAAVFACNFANYMWILSDKILRPEGCNINVFAPLLKETLRKALTNGPKSSQTGPARRGDVDIMRRHIAGLDGEEAKIYRILSEAIMSYFDIQRHIP